MTKVLSRCALTLLTLIAADFAHAKCDEAFEKTLWEARDKISSWETNPAAFHDAKVYFDANVENSCQDSTKKFLSSKFYQKETLQRAYKASATVQIKAAFDRKPTNDGKNVEETERLINNSDHDAKNLNALGDDRDMFEDVLKGTGYSQKQLAGLRSRSHANDLPYLISALKAFKGELEKSPADFAKIKDKPNVGALIGRLTAAQAMAGDKTPQSVPKKAWEKLKQSLKDEDLDRMLALWECHTQVPPATDHKTCATGKIAAAQKERRELEATIQSANEIAKEEAGASRAMKNAPAQKSR